MSVHLKGLPPNEENAKSKSLRAICEDMGVVKSKTHTIKITLISITLYVCVRKQGIMGTKRTSLSKYSGKGIE